MRTVSCSLLVLVAFGCAPAGLSPSRRGGSDAGPVVEIDAGTTPPPTDRPSDPPPSPDGCATGPGMDADGDGFPNGVDCNDCAAQINPGAFDEVGNGFDEDCDGADDVVSACDSALPMAPGSAEEAARALGLCPASSPDEWGLVSARFTTADGSGLPASMMQVGILPSFGASNVPVEGSALLALSSGVARAPGQPGYTSECDELDAFDPRSTFPPTFPQESRSCPGVRSGEVFDSVALEVTVRVPTNAHGFRFHSSFFTYEYPTYICDEFNDFFAVLRQDAGGWSNIVFDEDGNPVSVNNSLLRACEAGEAGGKHFDCPLGRAPLAGTGFDAASTCGAEGGYDEWADPWADPTAGPEVGGGTGWLRTVAPATPGETLTLRFIVWDSGDPTLDSTALLDGFTWELDPVDEIETVPDLI
ncbi:MAG: putative metal-binding motif-containing protein [Myxococcales bacterium]|nr:putative metal-binding motif-containing protein [Myxococcales bacterium]